MKPNSRHYILRISVIVNFLDAIQGVKRFGVLLATHPERLRFVAKLQKQLSTF